MTPFRLNEIGHVVLRARDLQRSADFYTRVLGMKVSDTHDETIALVGGMADQARKREMHHMAFEVGKLDEVFAARDHLRMHKVPIVFEGRRRAGVQIAVEFPDPDGHHLEIYRGLDQVGGDDGRVRDCRARAPRRLDRARGAGPRRPDASLYEAGLAAPSRAPSAT